MIFLLLTVVSRTSTHGHKSSKNITSSLIFSLISNEKNTKCIKMLCTVFVTFFSFLSGDHVLEIRLFHQNPLRHLLQVEEAVTMVTVCKTTLTGNLWREKKKSIYTISPSWLHPFKKRKKLNKTESLREADLFWHCIFPSISWSPWTLLKISPPVPPRVGLSPLTLALVTQAHSIMGFGGGHQDWFSLLLALKGKRETVVKKYFSFSLSFSPYEESQSPGVIPRKY